MTDEQSPDILMAAVKAALTEATQRAPDSHFVVVAFRGADDYQQVRVASTYGSRSEVRALLVEVVAQSVLADGLTVHDVPDVVKAEIDLHRRPVTPH